MYNCEDRISCKT